MTLLSSQLLSAPAIWYRPNGLRTSVGILGIYQSAAAHITRQSGSPQDPNSIGTQGLGEEAWITAVIRGADDNSSRWQHLLTLGGLLLGMSTTEEKENFHSIRIRTAAAFVEAVNLAVEDPQAKDSLARKTVTLVVSLVFDLLDDQHRVHLNHDLLLPKVLHAPFFDTEGLNSGYFLSTSDADVVQAASAKFDWSPQSSTFVQLQRMASGPLINSLGSISRLIAFCAENVQKTDQLATMLADLATFARCLCVQWRQNKLSEIDPTEESIYLTDETLRTSQPLLLRVLKLSMYAIIVVLRSVLGRVLGDARLQMDMRK